MKNVFQQEKGNFVSPLGHVVFFFFYLFYFIIIIIIIIFLFLLYEIPANNSDDTLRDRFEQVDIYSPYKLDNLNILSFYVGTQARLPPRVLAFEPELEF